MILAPGAFARHPLVDVIHNVPVKTCFLYGSYDWMTRGVADKLKDEGKLKEGSEVHTIENAGHQMWFDNPEGCSASIIGFEHGAAARKTFESECIQRNEANGPAYRTNEGGDPFVKRAKKEVGTESQQA